LLGIQKTGGKKQHCGSQQAAEARKAVGEHSFGKNVKNPFLFPICKGRHGLLKKLAGAPLIFVPGFLNNLQENQQQAAQQKAPSAVINQKSIMAYPNLTLIGALRQAAQNLESGATYAWGNHGACNCGHLLQVVTHLSRAEILRYAHTGIGEWTEIAETYCEVSHAPAYMLIAKLEAIGLTPTDIHCLEYLSDRSVLNELPGGYRTLRKNVREDVVLYFRTLAQQLEDKLLQTIQVPQPASLPEVAFA
jgi:hypothetical protein